MLPTGMFGLQKTDCNAKVKEAAEKFRKNQLKTQMFNLWKEKTGTKNPREWSSRYRTQYFAVYLKTSLTKQKSI